MPVFAPFHRKMETDQFFDRSFCSVECKEMYLILSLNQYNVVKVKPIFWGGGRNSPQWARASSFTRFLDNTRRTTVGRIPLDE